MSRRELTAAEHAGWRQYWDGWPICPECQAKKMAEDGAKEWSVPADYGWRGVGDAAKCVPCGARPKALDLINSSEDDRESLEVITGIVLAKGSADDAPKLIPWSILRSQLDATADLIRDRQRIGQMAYYGKDRR